MSNKRAMIAVMEQVLKDFNEYKEDECAVTFFERMEANCEDIERVLNDLEVV